MPDETKIRSFLGFDISDEMRLELERIIELLQPKLKDVRWVKPELMHCTLRFFGECEEELLRGKLSEVVRREVRHQAPIELVGRGFGVFPNWRYPRVLWAGLAGDIESVEALHVKLERSFEGFPFPDDPRQLRLHLTLARTKTRFKDAEGLVSIVEKMVDREFGSLMVREIVLYKSTLTKSGPVYDRLETFPLGGKG